MNRKNLLALLCVVMLGVQGVYAQCTIDPNNTTDGITPQTVPCITQGVAYTQTVQLHVPTSVNGGAATVDSVLVTGITGMPAGINLILNPVSPVKILGGGNGCIEITGTTNAAVGSYPLTVSITAWAKIGGVSPITQNTTLGQLGYNFALDVCAAPPAPSCDTLFNLSDTSSTAIYLVGQAQGGGYVSGNNGYGDLAKAERFTTTPGYEVNGAVFALGPVTYTNASTLVTFNVWDNSGTAGAPGNVLGSQTVSIGFLDTVSAQTQNPFIYIPFPTNPVTTSGTFYVGVVLPTTTGDTVVLYTNIQDTPFGDGWEQFSDGTWISYSSPNSWGSVFGNYIVAYTCPNVVNTNAPTAAFTGTNLTACGTSTTVAFTDQSTDAPTSWAWSFGDGGTSTQQNPSHTYNATGSYNVTLIATNANGSDTLVKNAYVNVKAVPTVTLAATQAGCGQNNGSVTSTAGGGNGTFTYAWSNSATSANLTNVAAGSYTVTVTSNGCTATASTTVTNSGSTLSADPTSTPATDANATDGTANANATGGTSPYTYSWSTTPAQTTATISGLAPGTYTVTVTDASGCQDIGSVVVTFGVGISDAKGGFTFSVMPNPASTQIRFEFNSAIQGEGYVFGTDGKLFETFAVNNQVETLNISNLPSGVYVVQVKERNSNKASFTRIVKY